MTKPLILIVDDEEVFLISLKNRVEQLGYDVVSAVTGNEAVAILEDRHVDIVIADLAMPDMNGIQLMHKAKEIHPLIPFVMITANGSVEGAVHAIRQGAFDYMEKPFSSKAFDVLLKRCLEFGRISGENRLLRGHFSDRFSFQNIVTQSPVMRKVLELATRISESPRTTVSLTGESGVGKEVLARAIHFASGGMPNNFIGLNCAAIPESLLESELFGHARGAFTGAEQDREGKFSIATGGTILLDEIGDMSLPLQAKLLRIIEERVYSKIGSNKELPADFRIIAATNRDLAKQVELGTFREDLYYRVNVVPIAIPALRDRKEDIPLLIDFFLETFRKHQGKRLPGVSKNALDMLLEYNWPGNIRELRNAIEYSAIVVQNELIRPEHIRLPTIKKAEIIPKGTIGTEFSVNIPVEGRKLSLIVDELTEQVLDFMLQKCHGNKSKASKMLGVNRKIFYR